MSSNFKRNGSQQLLDRLPPFSLEAEQGVLGCCILEPIVLAEAVSGLKAGEECFYDLRHRAIYGAMLKHFSANSMFDVIVLMQTLKDAGQLEAVGGIAYLSALPDVVPSASNLDHYLQIVREKFVLRRLIQVCTQTVTSAYESSNGAGEVIDQFEREAVKLSSHITPEADWSIKEAVHDSITEIENLQNRQCAISGLPTGFMDLDKMTHGLHPGEMTVLAGRPSMGKSALASNIAENLALNCKVPVGIFSLEMKKRSLVTRLICSRARVNLRDISAGFLAERDVPKLVGAAGKMVQAPIWIDDISGLTVMQLRAKARRMMQQYGVKLLIIDYLQLLMADAGRRYDNRQGEISYISSSVKGLAHDLDIPVVVLAQLNRELDREKRKPRLSDLRESGSIEQDADAVWMLYKGEREEDDDEAERGCDVVPVNVLIAKQRNGPTGVVRLTFLKSFTRFESAARISSEEMI